MWGGNKLFFNEGEIAENENPTIFHSRDFLEKENKSEWIAAFKAVGIKIGSSLHIFTMKCVRGVCDVIREHLL